MFYYKIEWFYQNFKSANMFFESILENTGPDPGDVYSFQMRNEIPLKLYRLFFHAQTGITFLLFRS